MLILVRKIQQGIWIDGEIFVKVLGVERDRVKLGITAPGNVRVMRQELFAEGEEPEVPATGERVRTSNGRDPGEVPPL